MLKGTKSLGRVQKRSTWYPHSLTSSPACSVVRGAKDLPDLIPELVREGVVIIIHGNAGSGKSHLVLLVQESLCSGAHPQFDLVVLVDFAKVGRNILSWKKLAKYLIEEDELLSSDETEFLEHLESNPSRVVVILDNIVDNLHGYVKQLLHEECGEIGRDSASAFEVIVDGVVSRCVFGPEDEKAFIQSKLEEMEEKMRKEVNLKKSIDPLVPRLEQNVARLKQLFYGPGGRVLVSRQDYSDLISHRHQIALGGFESPGTTLLFIKHHLSSEVTSTTRTQPLDLYLSMHPLIKHLCSIPKMAVILCDIYSSDTRCIKDTETSLVHKMVLSWVKIEVPEFKEESLYKLPSDVKEHFIHICKLAFKSTVHRGGRREEPFSLSDTEVNVVNLQSGFASLDEVKNFGLIRSKGNTIHNFIHSVIQDFLSAFYISCQPQNYQILFYYERFPTNIDSLLNVALFHFGLTRLETEEFFNPSKIILAPMIESLAHITEKKDGASRLELQKLIVSCLYQAQDSTLVKSFTQQYTDLVNISFLDVRALDDARMTTQMIFVILKSGIDSWEIVIPNENARGKTDSLVFPLSMVPDTSVKIDVKVQLSQLQSFTIRALFEPKPPKKTGRATEMIKRATNESERERYFKLAMICTGQRETLHRVTQLYSPVPVRSDAADPAYASLITCDCVEKRLEREVRFEPIHPIHMVQLGSKSKKAKAAEGDQDVTSKRHMEQKHKSCFMEMIVLNQPSVKSITFMPPGGGQPCRLVMSGERESTSTSGRIAMEADIEKAHDDTNDFTECVAVTEKDHSKSKMVPHGLPLPKSKSKMEADKGNVLQGGEVAGSRVHDDDMGDIPATAAQVAPSHKHFQDQDIMPYHSPALAQAESSEKITWRPGMIMHSVSLI